jgi:hypothetical protein
LVLSCSAVRLDGILISGPGGLSFERSYRIHLFIGGAIVVMSERSCPMSGSVGSGGCPMGNNKSGRVGPRGCNFANFSQPGDLREAFDVSNSEITTS